ncbi:unnamed protein product [Moneuplotes crassus]|uniref:PA14 domain-containing protein n=1 Tax=Euplotes crassus TaxID=5936 RepID=A0AAD1UM46_EUPCR|nr:unnamed protein product [Moneuplotes crassus]
MPMRVFQNISDNVIIWLFPTRIVNRSCLFIYRSKLMLFIAVTLCLAYSTLTFDASQSPISGVTSGESLVINQTYILKVQAKDSSGNVLTAGGEDIYARITDPCTRGPNMTCVASTFTQSATNGEEEVVKLTHGGSGIYSASLNLNHIGNATISVLRSGHQDIIAKYYNSGSISGTPDVTNTSATINFDFGKGNITPGHKNNVAAKFTGKLTPFRSGACTISVLQDDGATIQINGVTKMNNYGKTMFDTENFSYNFNAFETYDLEIDWKDKTEGAKLKLYWNFGSGKTLIPTENYAATVDVDTSPLQVSAVCPDKYEQTPSTTDQCRPKCGDGFVIDTEVCDDANTADGDGCKSDCTGVEPSWACSGGTTMTKSVCTECTQGFYQNDPLNPTSCVTKCGDGFRVGTEICDDNNISDGDGCKSDCTIESGYVCTGGDSANKDTCRLCSSGFYPNDSVQPTECITKCGDGQRVGSEACDDGNTIGGDGCSSDCSEIELAWKCDTSFPNVCTRNYKSVPMTTSEKSLQIVTLCAIPILVFMNTIGGSLSSSSTNSILSSINQLQLLILFLVCKVFIPLRAVTYLRTLSTAMIDINIDWSFFIVFKKIGEWFDFDQPRDDFDTIEISSGSALINLNTLVCMLIIYIITHFILWIAKKCVGKSKKLCARFIKKAYCSFIFQMYVVLIFEGFISLCLCSFSELRRCKVNATGPEEHSFYFSLFFASICLIAIFTILAVWLLIRPNQSNMKKFLQEELYTGVKPNRWARLQPFLFLVRRAALCLIITCCPSLDPLLDKPFDSFLLMGLYSLVNLAHLMLVCVIRPFSKTSENITEIGNEMFIATLCLFLVSHPSENDWDDTKATIFYWILVSNNILYAMFSIAMFIYTAHAYIRKPKANMKKKVMRISPKKIQKMQLNISRCLPRPRELADLRPYRYRNETCPEEGGNSSVPDPSFVNLKRYLYPYLALSMVADKALGVEVLHIESLA